MVINEHFFKMSFKFKTLIKKQPELKVCGVVTGGNGFDVCPPCSLEDERRKETDTGTPPRGRRADSHSSVNKSGPGTEATVHRCTTTKGSLSANSSQSELSCK